MSSLPSLEIESYYNILEKQKKLADIYKTAGDKAIFLIPSGLDKEPMLSLISGFGSFFGKRPAVWTWGDFYSEISNVDGVRPKRIIDPPDHKLILGYLIAAYLKKADTEGTELPPGVRHAGFESILGENIKDLLAEEISPAHILDTLIDDAEAESSRPGPESILYSLYSGYIEYLEANGIADNAQIPSLIADMLDRAEVSKFAAGHIFIPVGFLSFTGGQMKLISKLIKLSPFVFVLPETGIDSLHDSIRQVASEYAGRPSWKADIVELSANDSYLEYNALARELALWVHGKSGFNELGALENYGEIGIQVPAEKINVLQSSLLRYKIPFNARIRGSVDETLIGKFPRLIWNAYSSDWDTKATAFLLSSPLMGCAGIEISAFVSEFPQGACAWEKTLEGEALDRFKRVVSLCRDLSEEHTPVEVLKIWRDFISGLDIVDFSSKSIESMPELDQVLKDMSSGLGELDKKIDILEDISKDIGEASKQKISGRKSVAYISDWGRTATLPIQLPQSRSVTIYAGIPPVLTTHKYWIMTDVSYDTWPGKLRESPLLCNDSKKKINDAVAGTEEANSPHIPDIHEEREQKEGLFRRLIATAGAGVVIARSLTDSNGRPVCASQFMDALYESKDPCRKWECAGRIEYGISRLLPERDDLWFPEAEFNNSVKKKDGGIMPRAGLLIGSCNAKPVINLSDIDIWRSCPYFYWCRSRLKLENRKKELLDIKKAGIFLHELWKNCWREYYGYENKASFISLVISEWEKTVSANYKELETDRRLKRHMKRLRKQALDLAELQDDMEKMIKGRNDVGIEYVLDDYEINGALFRGRCDRIDFYSGGAVILDYKLNKASSHKDELQLAAYASVLSKTKGIRILGYGWLGHADKKLYGFFDPEYEEMYGVRKSKVQNLDEHIEKAETAMHDFAEALKKGSFPADYLAKYASGSMCSICDYFAICRKREAPYYLTEESEDASWNQGGLDND